MSEGKAGNRVAREYPGLLRDLTQKVLGENGEEWLDQLKPFLHKRSTWQGTVSKKRMKVLRRLEQIAEFPGADVFKVADYLRLTPDNERATAELVIGYLYNIGDNFLNKVEQSVPASKLRAHILKTDSRDNLIINDLGGEEAAETTFAEMVALMRRQGRGQQGILLTNGCSNIFYIRDTKSVLWAVYCFWDVSDDYWDVYANPISDPDVWYTDDRVFSRDSSGS